MDLTKALEALNHINALVALHRDLSDYVGRHDEVKMPTEQEELEVILEDIRLRAVIMVETMRPAQQILELRDFGGYSELQRIEKLAIARGLYFRYQNNSCRVIGTDDGILEFLEILDALKPKISYTYTIIKQ